MRGQTQEKNSFTTKQIGNAAEDCALHYLQAHGLQLVQRNYRTPGRGGGEIDLIMLDPHGTMVFIEVRKRINNHFGGAFASVSTIKRQRIAFAAKFFLMRLKYEPTCRFDVVAMDTNGLHWLKGAFTVD
ncbi:MAG: YraN family protein [Burkholderiales bacterium]|nr:YraN family protein [Burkholderiales bacterium]